MPIGGSVRVVCDGRGCSRQHGSPSDSWGGSRDFGPVSCLSTLLVLPVNVCSSWGRPLWYRGFGVSRLFSCREA